MKKEFRRYKQGEADKIYRTLSPKNKEIIKDFLDVCSVTAKEGKLTKIRRHLIQFYDITRTDLNEQTKETINHFLSVLNKSDKSSWTKNEIKCYLKKFLRLHYKDLDLIENIKGENRNVAQKVNENNLITEKDVEKMLRYAESFKEKAYLFLLFESGARPQELIKLRWQDIIFQNDYADINLYSNKTRKTRSFPVKKASKFLQDWKQNYSYPDVQPSDYVFVSRWRDKPMTSIGLNKMLRRMSKKAGLNKDVWNYLFRHTRATKLYEELPQQIVEKLMGHKNMAGVYAHISNKKAREMMLNKIYKVEEISENEMEIIRKGYKKISKLFSQLREDNDKNNKTINLLKQKYPRQMKEIDEKFNTLVKNIKNQTLNQPTH